MKFAGSGYGNDLSLMRDKPFGRFAIEAAFRADRVVVLNRLMADELVSQGVSAGRLRIMPHGVRVRAQAHLRSDLRLDGPTCLYAGRLVDHKGIDILLSRVWPNVVKRIPAACLVIAGDGPLKKDVIGAAIAMPGSIRYLGQRDDIRDIMAASTIVVLPSKSEGMSNVVLEANAEGTAVVGFDVPGIIEIVGAAESGWLVPVADWQALTVALMTALSDPGEAAMRGAAGRAHVSEHYSIERIASLYEELYEEVW